MKWRVDSGLKAETRLVLGSVRAEASTSAEVRRQRSHPESEVSVWRAESGV